MEYIVVKDRHWGSSRPVYTVRYWKDGWQFCLPHKIYKTKREAKEAMKSFQERI